MKYESFLLLAVVVVVLSINTFCHAATTYVNFMTSWTTLLSGGLSDCTDPGNVSATDCEGGLASADAYLRNYTNTMLEPVLYAFNLDRNSPFVQMHPLDWGVNRYVAQTIFNFSFFRATHATLTSSRNMTYLQTEVFPFVIGNALIPPSSTWIDFFKTVYYDEATKIAFISIQSGSQPNSYNSRTSIQSALDVISRKPGGPWYPVVTYDDATISVENFISFATDLTQVKMKPAAILVESTTTYLTPQLVNGTWICSTSASDSDITHIRFAVSSAEGFSSAEVIFFDLESLPQGAKDSYYSTKQIELKAESDKAAANDPVVGQSDLMPITRTGNFRICYGGECPLGNLWTDALKWYGDADVAFESAGGIRGSGWPAGGVKVSDLWSALPFINQICTGTISGINLFKALNYSISMATFTSTQSGTGDRLLQVSGCKVTYNTLLPATNRLVSVQVYNRVSGVYEPLERLKLYKFATNSFICTAFSPYPDFFTAADVAGEVAGSLGEAIVQEIVADYLGSLSSPYDTSIQGRLVNDTAAPSAMTSLVQSLATCPPDTYWRPTLQTCQPCAAGFVNPSPQDGSPCVAASKSTDIMPIVIGIAVPVALLLLGAVFYYFYRKDKMMRENIRDTENAPKVSGKPLAIIFTDIQASTNLWSVAPLSMSYSLEKHNQIINEIIALNHGFFVKAAGDSYMIAVDCTRPNGAQTAAKIVVDIQREMMKASFPRAINAIYNAKTDDDLLDVDDDPNDLEEMEPGMLFHGLRVRIGLAIGTCEVKFDSLAKTYDYYGSLVNLAARTEASAQGGQVLITPEANAIVRAADLNCMTNSCGKFELKGIPEPVELTQLMPIEYNGRSRLYTAPQAAKNNILEAGEHDPTVSDDESEVDQRSEDTLFLLALVRAVKPKEKDQIIRTLENAWRVRHHDSAAMTLAAVAKKVGRVKIMMAEQEERKAARDGQSIAVVGNSKAVDPTRLLRNRRRNSRSQGISGELPSDFVGGSVPTNSPPGSPMMPSAKFQPIKKGGSTNNSRSSNNNASSFPGSGSSTGPTPGGGGSINMPPPIVNNAQQIQVSSEMQ